MGAGTLSPWAPRLTILGSGTIRCTAKRQPPGYLVGDPNSGPCILIDPGPGTLAALPRAGATPEGIDLVLVTHTHIDHHLDLAALLFARHVPTYEGSGAAPLVVGGPSSLTPVLEGWSRLYGRWVTEPGWDVVEIEEVGVTKTKMSRFALLDNNGSRTWWLMDEKPGGITLQETQSVIITPDGQKTINGAPASDSNELRQIGNIEILQGQEMAPTGRVTPFSFLAGMSDPNTTIRRWQNAKFADESDNAVTVYFPVLTTGSKFMRPGLKFKIEGSPLEKLDFISLMLALFCGTAALPHILIRYYTVPDPASARKSTIVAIAAIGFFYILTLFMGLGATMNGVVPPADNNMAAPLLARSFTELLFAIISAIAFATILGTVSGLIVAASGAVAHDLADRYMGMNMSDQTKVKVGKISALVVGAFAIVLGIVFKGMNVSFLVGLAFAVAASANLPAIIMLLFWKKTTSKGITASIFTGIVSALVLISLSPDLFKQFGLDPTTAPIPFTNPGIISIPLSFTVLVVVSLMTQKNGEDEEDAEEEADAA